jgi:hydroxymethylpyrimidine/phosphomethylpyrimidine kinase
VRLPVVLTIAGSDSGGGAGIQADLKTFAALGVHGTSAITAVTAQNTLGVSDYVELPLPIIRAQIDDVVSDLRPVATKTGMLSSAEIIELVATAAIEHGLRDLVVDPVMVAKGGHRLLRDDAVGALRERLIPLAAVITPNLPEAEVLLGREIRSRAEVERGARDLLSLGCGAVVLKGGHAEEPETADDALFDGRELVWLSSPRVQTRNTHGSGCAFSAAITAHLAKGLSVLEAAGEAKRFITGAIRDALEVGEGHGPVNPMWSTSS